MVSQGFFCSMRSLSQLSSRLSYGFTERWMMFAAVQSVFSCTLDRLGAHERCRFFGDFFSLAAESVQLRCIVMVLSGLKFFSSTRSLPYIPVNQDQITIYSKKQNAGGNDLPPELQSLSRPRNTNKQQSVLNFINKAGRLF